MASTRSALSTACQSWRTPSKLPAAPMPTRSSIAGRVWSTLVAAGSWICCSARLNIRVGQHGGNVMAVVELLEAAGYRRIPLSRNGTGHFQAAGTLAGRRVTVLVDTGADSTVVSIDVARELGLALEPLKGAGGGAGGVNL